MANNLGTTHVTNGETLEALEWVERFSFQCTLRVALVPGEHWEEEDSNGDEHVGELAHHIEISVDTVAEYQEWVLDELILRLGHLHFHLSHESLSEAVSEVWLLFAASHFEAGGQTRNDVLPLDSVAKWVDILDVHESLVDLLFSKLVRLLSFPCNGLVIIVL